MSILDEFKSLGRLASGSSTHVKYRMVGLDVAEKRRQHAHNFLSGKKSTLVGIGHQLFDVLQVLVFLEELLLNKHLKDKPLRVVFFLLHLQLGQVKLQSS